MSGKDFQVFHGLRMGCPAVDGLGQTSHVGDHVGVVDLVEPSEIAGVEHVVAVGHAGQQVLGAGCGSHRDSSSL